MNFNGMNFSGLFNGMVNISEVISFILIVGVIILGFEIIEHYIKYKKTAISIYILSISPIILYYVNKWMSYHPVSGALLIIGIVIVSLLFIHNLVKMDNPIKYLKRDILILSTIAFIGSIAPVLYQNWIIVTRFNVNESNKQINNTKSIEVKTKHCLYNFLKPSFTKYEVNDFEIWVDNTLVENIDKSIATDRFNDLAYWFSNDAKDRRYKRLIIGGKIIKEGGGDIYIIETADGSRHNIPNPCIFIPLHGIGLKEKRGFAVTPPSSFINIRTTASGGLDIKTQWINFHIDPLGKVTCHVDKWNC